MKIKLIILLLIITGTQALFSQFVEIEINLYSAGRLHVLNRSQASDKTGVLNGNSKELMWLGIGVCENIFLTVNTSYRKLDTWERKEPVLYQNDGTTNLAAATAVTGDQTTFQVSNKSRLRDDLNGQESAIIVWIGIPVLQLKEFMVDYN